MIDRKTKPTGGKRGRPALPPDEKISQRLRIFVTESQLEEMRAWAAREEKSMAVLIREAILRAARKGQK